MIRFIHTADIHLGVENYGTTDPKTGLNTRLLDFHRALQECITYAITNHVDFFLFCGDAYKTSTPTPTQQKLLLSSFLQLYQAKIPVVIVVGNHDNPFSFGKIHALDIFGDLPIDGFHVINKPACITFNTAHGPISIVGVPWPTKAAYALTNQTITQHQVNEHITRTISTIIHDFAKNLDPAVPAILAGHLTMSSGMFSGSEKRAIHGNDPTFLPSSLAIAPFAYVALGHLHKHQIINPNGFPPIVYSGSLERIDFGERAETKGFCEIVLENAQKTTVNFVPVNTRKFVQIDVKFENTTVDQTAHVIAAIKQLDIKNAVLKITYQLQPGQKDLVDIKAVQLACAPSHYVAGIQAIRPAVHKERRSNAKVEMDFQTLMQEYFAQKPELNERREALTKKIMSLKTELDNG